MTITPQVYIYATLGLLSEIGFIPGQSISSIKPSHDSVVHINPNSQSLNIASLRSQTITFAMLVNMIENLIEMYIVSNIGVVWVKRIANMVGNFNKKHFNPSMVIW